MDLVQKDKYLEIYQGFMAKTKRKKKNILTIVFVIFYTFGYQQLKVPITSVGILHICNRWILLKTILIYLVS